MKVVYIYQIIDHTSESVISNFIGPNDAYAKRQFEQFLKDPKLEGRIDYCDFVLTRTDPVYIIESYMDDFCNQDRCHDDELKPVYPGQEYYEVSFGRDYLPVEENNENSK